MPGLNALERLILDTLRASPAGLSRSAIAEALPAHALAKVVFTVNRLHGQGLLVSRHREATIPFSGRKLQTLIYSIPKREKGPPKPEGDPSAA